MNGDFSPNSDGPVLVIGGSAVDIVGSLKEPIRMGVSNLSQIRTSYGGVGRNLAENLARLGQPVKLISVVGEDDFGDNLIDHGYDAGVDMSSVLISPKAPTGFYLGVVDEKGNLQVALDDMRVMQALTPDFLEDKVQLFKEASLLFIDANLSKATLRKAISLAWRVKIPICGDPTAFTLAHRFLKYLPRLKLITPDVLEAGVLCGREIDPANQAQVLESAKSIVSQGIDIVVITLAQFGVCYATSKTSGFIPAIRMKITDPTGGGDAFSSGLIFGLLNGMQLDEAVRLGVSAATLTLQYPGAVVPDLSLEKLYDQLVI